MRSKVHLVMIFFCTNLLYSETATKNFNVVLFLAKTHTNDRFTDDSGIKCLNFQEKARVKHCTTELQCPDLLGASVISLLSYARNVLGMTTAIATLTNDTFSNSLRSKKDADISLTPKSGYNSALKRTLYINLSPPSLKLPRSDFKKLLKKKRSEGKLANKKIGSENDEVITDPEHTEVFKLRTKRHRFKHQDQQDEGCDNDKKKSLLDSLGVTATLKLTFFGKLLDDKKDGDSNVPPMKPLKTVNTNYMNEHSTKCSLFDLVKKTLENVLDSCQTGYLIVILGGSLLEVSDPYSQLTQSVKYVTELTDDSNTLIVVTGSCPCPPTDSSGTSSGSDQSGCEDVFKLIPVFVKGPKCEEFQHTKCLYDVPYSVKNVLAGMSIAGETYNTRLKRQIDDDRQGNPLVKDSTSKDRKRSGAPKITHSFLFYISFIAVIYTLL